MTDICVVIFVVQQTCFEFLLCDRNYGRSWQFYFEQNRQGYRPQECGYNLATFVTAHELTH